jgi:FG-GAP-like repeat/FG-GAP repeat
LQFHFCWQCFLIAFPMNHVGATSSSTPLFLPVVTYGSLGRGSASVAVADLNGDSKPDLVVAGILGGPLSILLGNGDGTFHPAVGVGSAGFSVAVADLNGDGKPDLAVTNLGLVGTVEVMLGNGDGSFQPAVAYPSGGAYSSSAAVADVNGDSKLDLVVTNGHYFWDDHR